MSGRALGVHAVRTIVAVLSEEANPGNSLAEAAVAGLNASPVGESFIP